MEVLKGRGFIRFDNWELSIDKEYPDRILWCHIHKGEASWELSGDGFACVGDPLACRRCALEIPKSIIMLGLLQRIGLERGE